jgi:hypothetical protein
VKYFKHPYTADGAAKQYKELAKILHPDKGGDKAEFQLLTREYELVKKICGVVGTTRPGRERPNGERIRRARPHGRTQITGDVILDYFKQGLKLVQEMNEEFDKLKRRRRK